MILDKEVEITIGTKNKRYYTNLGYSITSVGQKIIISVGHLMSWSSIKINAKCDICGKETKIKYRAYTKNTKNNIEPYCCCNKCANKKRNDTNLEKYGVEFVSQNEEINRKMKNALVNAWENKPETEKEFIIEKRENTCLKNFGYKNPLSNKDIRCKIEQTNLNKYGVANVFQNEDIKKKSRQTCKKNYGVEYPWQSEEIKEKTKQIKLEKYDDENYNNRELAKNTWLEKYGVENPMQDPNIFKRAQKTSFKVSQYKNTNLTYQAGYEKYFLELMDKYGFLNELSMGKPYNYLFKGIIL